MPTAQETEITTLLDRVQDSSAQLTRQVKISRLKDALLMESIGKPVRRVLQFDLFQDGPQVAVVVRPVHQLRFGAAPVRIELLDGVAIEDVPIYLQHVLDNLADYTSEHVAGSVVKLVPHEREP